MQLYTSQTLSQRQSMVVTAQLQQAIQLLQMGNSDLQSFIEGQAEENPFGMAEAAKIGAGRVVKADLGPVVGMRAPVWRPEGQPCAAAGSIK